MNGMLEPLVFGVNADAVNKSFAPAADEFDLTGVTLEFLGDKNLKATLDATVRESFVIPESYYGYRFTEIYLWNDTDRDIEITVPSTVTDFSVGSVFGIGSNVTVNYSGSLSEFEGIVSAYKSVTKFAHYLICDDFEGYYKSSVIEVSFGGKTYFALVSEFMEGYRFSLYTTDLITDYREGVYRYYYTDQFGREYTVSAPGYSDRHIFGDFETEADICDLILTYHEQLSPPDDMPTQGDK
jgi:hypothetical protein